MYNWDLLCDFGGGGVAVDGDAEPSAASGGCSEAEHPQRSKKSSKRAARRFFRAPQGGWGRCARGYLGSASVRSADLDFSTEKNLNPKPAQLSVKEVCKGESPVPLCPVLLPFAGAKGRPPRRAVLTTPLQKAVRRRRRDETGIACIGNPSVTAAPCHLPLHKGGYGSRVAS